jgi:hypothetical protein
MSWVPNNYERWETMQISWSSLSDFMAAWPWADGIHTVTLGSGPALDILIKGQPYSAGPVIPVFFNGAVSGRDSHLGPFFSGSGIAAKLGLGFIAFSDPSLNLDRTVGIGWYAGNRFSSVQDQISEILAAVAERSGRELLLIGGSGGGFASLYYGGRLNSVASAIVWNPQTDIHRYNPKFVDLYINQAWGSEPVTAQTAVVGSLPRRLFYTQNASDWHVSSHAQPYIQAGEFTPRGRGVFESTPDRVVCIADYGDGHAALPEAPLLTAIELMMNPKTTASQAVDGVIARHAVSWTTPKWTHPQFNQLGDFEVPKIPVS